jgi:hypothetical protein
MSFVGYGLCRCAHQRSLRLIPLQGRTSVYHTPATGAVQVAGVTQASGRDVQLDRDRMTRQD